MMKEGDDGQTIGVIEKQCHNDKAPKLKSHEKRNRKKDPLVEEYKNLLFTQIEPSGRPGTPHSFFESSYGMSIIKDETKSTIQKCNDENESQDKIQEVNNDDMNKESDGLCHEKLNEEDQEYYQVVHQHANGLCIVTGGSSIQKSIKDGKRTIASIEFQKVAPDPQSIGGKRKKKAKLKKNNGQTSSGMARPSDSLAVVTLDNGQTIDLKCCVYGTILEINEKLQFSSNDSKNNDHDVHNNNNTPQQSLLVSDPLLDGYLAVILPTGTFPLSENIAK